MLERAIDAGAEPARVPRTRLLRHRAKGETCPRCVQPLESHRVGGRAAWMCPRCQRDGPQR